MFQPPPVVMRGESRPKEGDPASSQLKRASRVGDHNKRYVAERKYR